MKRIYFTVINDLNYDQRMIRICGTLSESGFDCILVGRELENSLPLEMRKYKQKRLYCFFEKGKLFYLEYNIRLFFFLLFLRMDAICSIDVDTALPGLWVSKLKGKKHLFDAHELFTEVPEVTHRKLVKKIWAWVQKKAFQQTDAAYTVGVAIAAHFEKLYHKKVEVVKNAPPLATMRPYKPDTEKFILYQGALNAGRGLEMLIEAMQQIPCKLVLAGEGDLSKVLRQKVVNLGLENKVTFMGYVKPDALQNLTNRAYIGYNVSENAGLSYYLSMNNKFFDYVHAGLPSLINPFPEYVALNNQFSVGVITNSVVSDIVKNAEALLLDPKLHQQLSENCRKAAQVLNWETESLKLLSIYNGLFEK